MNTNNYNIKVDPEALSDEQIMKHRDFKKVLYNYEKMTKPLYLRPRTLSAFIAVVTVSVVLIWFDDAVSNKKPFINPPSAEIIIPYEEDSGLIAEKGGTLEYESGAVIIFPPSAFVNQDGEPVTGLVEIKYREFHDHLDLIYSGIPMNYDSAGTGYFLQSAGMFDLRAYQHGEPLFVNPGKEIEVQFPSTVREPGYNFYYLDTNERKWVYNGVDTFSPAVEADASGDSSIRWSMLTVSSGEETRDTIQKTATEGTEARTEKHRFVFDLSYEDFPEFAAYENVTWVIEENQSDFNPQWIYDKQWDDARIVYATTDGIYLIRLISEEKEYTLKARPLLSDADQAKARNTYAALKNMPGKNISKQLGNERKKYAAETASRAEYEAKMIEIRDLTDAAVTRVFRIRSFGIWNSDKPIQFRTPVDRIAKITYDKEVDYSARMVYYIDKRINTAYPIGDGFPLGFDPEWNIIFSVLPGGKAAIYSAAEHRTNPRKPVPGEAGRYDYVLRVLDGTFKTVEEIKAEIEKSTSVI